MSAPEAHEVLAERLRRRVAESGVLASTLREGAFSAGAGSVAALPEPYQTLANLVGQAAYRVTDDLVRETRDASGSETATFELIMSASIGAGLRRWDAATRAIEEATRAS